MASSLSLTSDDSSVEAMPVLLRSISNPLTASQMEADVKLAQKWIALPERNVNRFSLTVDPNTRSVVISCPTVETKDGRPARFSITLDKPHSIAPLDKALRKIEDDSADFCFGGTRSIVNVLSWASNYITKLWEPDEDEWDRPADDVPETMDEDDDEPMRATDIDYDFKVIDKAEIDTLQRSMITALAARLSISLGAAGVLLRAYKWNPDALVKEYKSDAKEVVKKVGCGAILHGITRMTTVRGDKPFLCEVCFSEHPMDETFALKCDHRLCLGCWRGHLEGMITVGTGSGANCLFATCWGYECKEMLGEEVFEFMCDDDLMSKYRQMLLNSFVDESADMKWCPAPGCEKVVMTGRKKRVVKCSCGFKFCFLCKEEAHFPASCDQALSWRQRDKGSASLDVKYIMEQTKPCPHCGVRTNKNGGCMYMTCAQCKKAWCWQCGKSDHHVWECSRPAYELKEVKEGDDMNRYLFYFERFFNHSESRKFAEKQKLITQAKIQDLVSQGRLHIKGVDFLTSAVELVIECRRVLKWTYVKAFTINPKHEREAKLFEFRQKDLEEYTEKLNQLTEGTLDDLEANRQSVINWTESLNKYLAGMEEEQKSPTLDETTDTKKSESSSSSSSSAPAKAGAVPAKGAAAGAAAAPPRTAATIKVDQEKFFAEIREKKAAAAAGVPFKPKADLLAGAPKLGVPSGRFAPKPPGVAAAEAAAAAALAKKQGRALGMPAPPETIKAPKPKAAKAPAKANRWK